MITIVSLTIAFILTVVLVAHIGICSLLAGSVDFLFGKPKFNILKTSLGPTGFAFSFDWNNSKEPSNFNLVRVRLFNPFGKKTQVDVSKNFTSKKSSFATDVDLGPEYKAILACDNINKSRVMIEVSSDDGLSFQYEMPTSKFINKIETASSVADKFNLDEKKSNEDKVYYHTVSQSHVATQVNKTTNSLKISTNPEFAGDFQETSSAVEGQANFKVAKVWIESGCIVCNACEDAEPSVFKVNDDGCIVIAGATLDDGLKILEAAEACPVEIIKFDKAS